MKRMQLTEAEAAFIEKTRAKNAKISGFNEGVDACLAYIEAFQLMEDSSLFSIKTSLAEQLPMLKKPELIP